MSTNACNSGSADLKEPEGDSHQPAMIPHNLVRFPGDKAFGSGRRSGDRKRKYKSRTRVARWFEDLLSTVRRRALIIAFLVLFVGSIVTAGVLVVTELAHKYRDVRRKEVDSKLKVYLTETASVQTAGMLSIPFLAAHVVTAPDSPTVVGAPFQRVASAGVRTLMQGLAGRYAGIYAGSNETLFIKTYQGIFSSPLIVACYLFPGGEARGVWINPATIGKPEEGTFIPVGTRLYDDPFGNLALKESGARRAASCIKPYVKEDPSGSRLHILTCLMPVFIEVDGPGATFGDFPAYPYCNNVTFCYSNSSSSSNGHEKLWGWVGTTLSVDRILTTSTNIKEILAEGFKVSGVMTPNALLKPALEGTLGSGQQEFLGNINDTQHRFALSGMVIRGALWTFVGYLAPPFDLKAPWRIPLYVAVAIIAVVLGGSYLRMALTRAEYNDLLRSVLPRVAVNGLLKGETVLDNYEDVSILILEISAYHGMEKNMHQMAVVRLLHEIFTRYDAVVERYGGMVTKLGGLGDSLMACTNCPVQGNPAVAAATMASFALDLLTVTRDFTSSQSQTISVKIGVHTGSVCGAVLGYLKPSFEILSPSVNITSVIQSSAPHNSIMLSDKTADLIKASGRLFKLTPVTIHDFPEYGRLVIYSLARSEYTVSGAVSQVTAYAKVSDITAGFAATPGRGAAKEEPIDPLDEGLPVEGLRPIKVVPQTEQDLVRAPGCEIPTFSREDSFTQASARNVLRFDKNFPDLMQKSLNAEAPNGA